MSLNTLANLQNRQIANVAGFCLTSSPVFVVVSSAALSLLSAVESSDIIVEVVWLGFFQNVVDIRSRRIVINGR